MTDRASCPACGVLVGDPDQHWGFHDSLRELREAVIQQQAITKQVSTALAELAPVMYELAQSVMGPVPAGIAREIERALASIKEKAS